MNIPDEAVEAAARAMAILDDYDGCFLEVDAWKALEDWERDAHPENYPGMAIEDCAYWLKVAKAGMDAAAPHLMAAALDEAASIFQGRLPDGTGNGRAYNSYQVADMLRARAAATRNP